MDSTKVRRSRTCCPVDALCRFLELPFLKLIGLDCKAASSVFQLSRAAPALAKFRSCNTYDQACRGLDGFMFKPLAFALPVVCLASLVLFVSLAGFVRLMKDFASAAPVESFPLSASLSLLGGAEQVALDSSCNSVILTVRAAMIFSIVVLSMPLAFCFLRSLRKILRSRL